MKLSDSHIQASNFAYKFKVKSDIELENRLYYH